MPENPWLKIERSSLGQVNALRVSDSNRFDFFWARNSDGRCMLLLNVKEAVDLTPQFPQLRGIGIHWSGQSLQLQLLLYTDRNWELFLTLCNDVIGRTQNCSNGADALETVRVRLISWQRFLAKSSTATLSERERQGLFGELVFLRGELMSRLPAAVAINSWHGPEGTPQDFALGATSFEVKTHLAESARTILISSPEQLWTSFTRNLFLVVVPILRLDRGGTSLLELVQQIGAELEGTSALLEFEDRLASLGYIDLDEYSSPRYQPHTIEYYRVQAGFPSIPSTAIPAGVSDVHFSLQLEHCSSFVGVPEWGEIVEHTV